MGAASSLRSSSSRPALHGMGLLPRLHRLRCSEPKGSKSFLWPPTYLLLFCTGGGREAGLGPAGCLPADACREAARS